jgi:hypothetical protein
MRKENAMNQPLSTDDLGSDVLKHVEEGMDVYDRENHKIGRVKQVYFGEVDEGSDALGKGPMTAGTPPTVAGGHWLANTGRALDDALGDDDLPQVARDRLLRSGFIQVDTGLLHSDFYAQPEHIASVQDGKVRLRVRGDELIKK